MTNSKNNLRADRVGAHRTAFDKNRKRIIATQDYCYLCGKLVDKSLKRPDPMAAEVDHIIPIAKGGHPSDIANLCLVHGICNRQKGDKMLQDNTPAEHKIDPLAWSFDWVSSFKAEG